MKISTFELQKLLYAEAKLEIKRSINFVDEKQS